MPNGKPALMPFALALLLASFGSGAPAPAPGTAPAPNTDPIAVHGPLPPAPPGVTDLKFKDFYQLPVGPRGLEPTPKLLGLNGQRVRLVGYLAHQEAPAAGLLYLASFPIELGDEDESLSDDLPASTVFIHLPGDKPAPYVPGLVRLTGRLSVSPREEPDGRVSSVRLRVDPEVVQALMAKDGGPERSAPPAGAPTAHIEKTSSQSHPNQ